MNKHPKTLNRRQFIQASVTLTSGLWLTACTGNATPEPTAIAQSPATAIPPTAIPATFTPIPATVTPIPVLPTDMPTAIPTATDAPTLVPTPQCVDPAKTPAQTEGPYYTSNTPERASLLEAGVSGTKLIISGQVLTTDCQPVAQAMLDFWHADDAGKYDNAGYRLRGHQFTDAQGQYRLETIVPGLYPGRTRHIHVIVQGPTQAKLTTQLYFPDEPANQTDNIFDPELVMAVTETPEGKTASFNFVLA